MFAVLHLADFPLHAVLRTQCEVPPGPAALLDDVSKRSLILTCNDRARAAGVGAGHTAPQALAHCSALRFYARSRAAEVEAGAVLQAAAFLVSPKVEATAEGVCTMDLSGLDEGRQRMFLLAALERLHAADLPATGGLAATPLLALYAARSVVLAGAENPATPVADASSPPREGRDSLRVEESDPCASAQGYGRTQGAGRATPERIRVIRDPRAFLAPLPLSAADPGAELAAILTAWGIHTLGALTALPKEDVARRLGPAGLALWKRAAGETTRVLRLVTPATEFVARMEFEHEIETLEPLLFILRRLVDRFALELETAMLAAIELVVTLELADDSRHERSFRLPEPTTRADTLLRTLHTHLEQLRTDASIKAVQLRIEPGRPLRRQQGLFETGLRDPHSFAETLARLVAIAGSGRVGTPCLENTHRPDAVVMEAPASVVEPAAAPAPVPPAGLPLRRFRPPLVARMQVDDAGAFVSVWSPLVCGEVIAQRGPWHGSGEWWEAGRAWARAEWDIELSGGGLYRLVRTKDGWFVEGEYD